MEDVALHLLDGGLAELMLLRLLWCLVVAWLCESEIHKKAVAVMAFWFDAFVLQ